jgi:ATP-dependent helicase/nuclease subunit A
VPVHFDQRLGLPVQSMAQPKIITPSHSAKDFSLNYKTNDEDGSRRGIAIHRILELLSSSQTTALETLLEQAAGEFAVSYNNPEFRLWWEEALGVVQNKPFRHVFDPNLYLSAHNEIPLQYRADNKSVFGIIDRLVLTEHEVIVIDYKTHRCTDTGTIALLSEHYSEQMALYAHGIQRIWPHRRVRTQLLFTSCLILRELPVKAMVEKQA